MLVNDIWGVIKIDKKYVDIINSKEFQSLRQKPQLGLNPNPNAIHTRYQHSIGTYAVATKLIDLCKRKFSNILNITSSDEEAIKCMALVHDLGHGPFSHVSESVLDGTHEDNTVRILLDKNSEVHKAIIKNLGEDVLEKVINLINLKVRLKEKEKFRGDNNLIFIIGKLLSGGIDIDRIDYIYRDSKNVTGEINDFSSILEGINIEYIDDSLEVVFDSSVEYKIANFFNKRFELYDSLYLCNEARIIDSIFSKFIKLAHISIDWHTSEISLRDLFEKYLTSDDITLRRYASILNTLKLDQEYLIKEINDRASFTFFQNKIYTSIPELANYPEVIITNQSKISIYNSDNKIFINNHGLIEDISECSKILNSELKKDKYIIGIDLYLLKKLLRKDSYSESKISEIIKKINKLMSNEIEQEKKYTLKDNITDPLAAFKIIRDNLNLSKPKYIKNMDTYFTDSEGILRSHRIAVRKRIGEDGEIEYTIKRPLKDKSSISKRNEKNFPNLELAYQFLTEKWQIPIKDLSYEMELHTKRVKYNLEYCGGTFEVVFDMSIPKDTNGSYEPSFMIECELKSGNSTGLYFLNEQIKELGLTIDCNNSKEEIALETIKNKKLYSNNQEVKLELKL